MRSIKGYLVINRWLFVVFSFGCGLISFILMGFMLPFLSKIFPQHFRLNFINLTNENNAVAWFGITATIVFAFIAIILSYGFLNIREVENTIKKFAIQEQKQLELIKDYGEKAKPVVAVFDYYIAVKEKANKLSLPTHYCACTSEELHNSKLGKKYVELLSHAGLKDNYHEFLLSFFGTYAENEYDVAYRELNDLIRLAYTSLEPVECAYVWLLHGNIEYRKKEFRKAISSYSKSISFFRDNPSAYFQLVNCFFELQMTIEGTRNYLKANVSSKEFLFEFNSILFEDLFDLMESGYVYGKLLKFKTKYQGCASMLEKVIYQEMLWQLDFCIGGSLNNLPETLIEFGDYRRFLCLELPCYQSLARDPIIAETLRNAGIIIGGNII